MSKKDSKILEKNEILKTQIDASIGVARSLVQSWLSPPKHGEKLEDTEYDEKTFARYSTGRPDRVGLGAKFLSHKEAIQHQSPTISKNEMKLRNKIINQNRRADNISTDAIARKRGHESDSDNEEESRTRSVRTNKKNTTASPSETSTVPDNKKIGTQGDFLSMYLSEKAGKKKKGKKNKKVGKTDVTV
ncbi:hypothetical protein BDA99DRAFT_529185 [Phascolomyces articulosus]|uniref:Uncharacterized protein n=1 Tax=Phascolomyces articulosus TaxID=60185 RepID=A0AAD5JM55_9FUNG|nr:hypothetical protein BDA99DRAFT_529185 [Phascolomyces articulosus]